MLLSQDDTLAVISQTSVSRSHASRFTKHVTCAHGMLRGGRGPMLGSYRQEQLNLIGSCFQPGHRPPDSCWPLLQLLPCLLVLPVWLPATMNHTAIDVILTKVSAVQSPKSWIGTLFYLQTPSPKALNRTPLAHKPCAPKPPRPPSPTP